jgi:hypothetical protein
LSNNWQNVTPSAVPALPHPDKTRIIYCKDGKRTTGHSKDQPGSAWLDKLLWLLLQIWNVPDTTKFELEAEQMGRKEIQKSKWQKFAKQKCSEGREFHMNFLLFSLFYKLRHFSCKPDSKVLNYG